MTAPGTALSSWTGVPDDHPFSLGNLPYGSASDDRGGTFAVTRIGDLALDLTRASAVAEPDLLPLFARGTLDDLLAAGPPKWTQARAAVKNWLTDPAYRDAIEPLLRPAAGLDLRLPFTVADYADFYGNEHHAANASRIFRPGATGAAPNWRHLPVGYHGCAGTVVVSGTAIRRPQGQYRDADGTVAFGPSRRLDLEAEVGFVVGSGSAPGSSVAVAGFGAHVFGACLVNDWSARDIQMWESTPLGPFLGKSFGTSVSAWITPLEALNEAWIAPPARDPAPLAHLDDSARPNGLDLALEVRLNGETIATPSFGTMYWTPPQMLAHLTSGGAALRPGDLFASGTVSGPRREERGCLLEYTWNGAEPLTLADGSVRTYLEDGDEVVITATAPALTGRIALGEVRGRVTPP
ncbi:MAG TPA: fumarylacetoacetate hydrolase family protein [Streptosporangiaceae bacterium]|nr:fumarylacetoacetate hydrolase family protein [Streptosporangiaceae bacterium]